MRKLRNVGDGTELRRRVPFHGKLDAVRGARTRTTRDHAPGTLAGHPPLPPLPPLLPLPPLPPFLSLLAVTGSTGRQGRLYDTPYAPREARRAVDHPKPVLLLWGSPDAERPKLGGKPPPLAAR